MSAWVAPTSRRTRKTSTHSTTPRFSETTASGSAPAAVPLVVPPTKISWATRARRMAGLTSGPSSG
jgi:hypothetical protein